MSLLFETIRIVDGVPLHLEYHQERVDRSRAELFGARDLLSLQNIVVPGECRSGTFRLKVSYDLTIQSVTYGPYAARQISSLKLIVSDDLEYGYKFADRSSLESLKALRAGCDEILIVKNDRITDTSFSNIAFLDTSGRWATPERPLLKGTCRERLLREQKLYPAEIRPEDLPGYRAATLINAMLDPGDVVIPTSRIL